MGKKAMDAGVIFGQLIPDKRRSRYQHVGQGVQQAHTHNGAAKKRQQQANDHQHQQKQLPCAEIKAAQVGLQNRFVVNL